MLPPTVDGGLGRVHGPSVGAVTDQSNDQVFTMAAKLDETDVMASRESMPTTEIVVHSVDEDSGLGDSQGRQL